MAKLPRFIIEYEKEVEMNTKIKIERRVKTTGWVTRFIRWFRDLI